MRTASQIEIARIDAAGPITATYFQCMFNIQIPQAERTDMLHRLLAVLFIALILSFAICSQSPRANCLVYQLIYSFSIAFLIWLFGDVGDVIVFKNSGKRFPYTFKRYLFAIAAVVVGNTGGFLIGNWFSGWHLQEISYATFLIWTVILIFICIGLIWLFTQKQYHKDEQISNAETRLRLLQSQLEPHMLYNTLANLRALVSQDSESAIQMLDRIVDYMRATLKGSRSNLHALQAEFERLDDYLKLMTFRMGQRLEYSMYLSPKLKKFPVPTFILQSLVENAIKHGLEPKIEGGRIFIKAELVGNQVILEVNDTGVGAEKDDLVRSNGFGWVQVTDRLMAIYGHKATISLTTTESYRTSAKISIPYNEIESLFE